MQYLHPWFIAMKHSPEPFAQAMQDLGFAIEADWVSKKSVVECINSLCQSKLGQKAIWQQVHDSRKSLKDYDFLFPNDPLSLRTKRQFCHFYEAWYTVALLCAKHQCLHLWLRHFNLNEEGEIMKAKQILFTGTVIVNGIHIEGQGIIRL